MAATVRNIAHMSTPPEETDPTGPLQPPYGLTVVNSAEGGWSVILTWQYSFRYQELNSFTVSRLKEGEVDWEVIETDIPNGVRTFNDMLPDESAYTYVVTAYPADGGEPLISDPPMDAAGEVIYVTADIATTKPQNIRKPLRSCKRKMFIAWNYHIAASSYMLEALDEVGDAYYSVYISDVLAPYGLFVGPHPTDMITVRVTVMRRHDDGSEYAASSAEEEFFVDDIRDPHFGVVDIEGQDANTLLQRNLAFGVVLALAEYGNDIAHLNVNGIEYGADAWSDHDGTKSATIEYCVPAGSAPVVGMRITAPDNLQVLPGS